MTHTSPLCKISRRACERTLLLIQLIRYLLALLMRLGATSLVSSRQTSYYTVARASVRARVSASAKDASYLRTNSRTYHIRIASAETAKRLAIISATAGGCMKISALLAGSNIAESRKIPPSHSLGQALSKSYLLLLREKQYVRKN